MLNRKSLIKCLSMPVIALTGLAAITNSSPASPNFALPKASIEIFMPDAKEIEENYYTRNSMIPSYSEWKTYNESQESLKTKEDIEKFDKVNKIIRRKIYLMLENPKKAYELLTEKEKMYYKLELNMLDPEDMAIDCMRINQRYKTTFTTQEFEQSNGAKLIWFLDRFYGYKKSDEKSEEKK